MNRDPELVQKAVQPLIKRWDLGKQIEPFAEHRWEARASGYPALHLDDVSGIPFLDGIPGVTEYQHRARLRCREGDLFASVTPVVEGYEDYCRNQLGLGHVEHLLAEPDGEPVAVALACSNGSAFEALVRHGRRARGLTLHPYMAIGEIWDLARKVHSEAEVPVKVVGPPPPVLWIANDKARFSEVVRAVLGDHWLVESHGAFDVSTLSAWMLDLAGRHERIGLKRLRCASAMGNAVFLSEDLRRAGRERVERSVRGFLRRTRWPGDEEVLVVAWERTDISPSTQLWIPPLGEGWPRLDGIYEQILKGKERVFVGSRPSQLTKAAESQLADASLQLAVAFQWMGYVGRCSFDFLLLGDPYGKFELRLTECNGRWGGTSIPMYLVDRLISGARPCYRAQDFEHPGLKGMSLETVLERVGDQAFDSRTGKGRFIFYNLGPLEEFGKLDVIALGKSQREADMALRWDLPQLLGLD